MLDTTGWSQDDWENLLIAEGLGAFHDGGGGWLRPYTEEKLALIGGGTRSLGQRRVGIYSEETQPVSVWDLSLHDKEEADLASVRSEIERIAARLPGTRRLVFILRASGMTQLEIAEKLGVSQPTVSCHLQKTHEVCRKLAQVPEVSPEEILSWVREGSHPNAHPVETRVLFVESLIAVWSVNRATKMSGVSQPWGCQFIKRKLAALPDHPVSKLIQVIQDYIHFNRVDFPIDLLFES